MTTPLTVDQLKAQWLEAVKADAELGGENLDESFRLARLAIQTFGTWELEELLNLYGLDCHPAMLRMLVWIGRQINTNPPDEAAYPETERSNTHE